MKRFVGGENGATAIEYAVMAGFIAAIIASAIVPIGITVTSFFLAAAAGFS
jgi:Flp pilus assembly pilin Flp